jgi:hypothetical protein
MSPIPQGLILGNDIDNRFLPGIRTKKLASPATVLTIGNAAKWPPQFEKNTDNDETAPSRKQLLYDRIICDVPCSGDGTIRKNPSIWRSWQKTFTFAFQLHTKQLKILLRGLHHLKPGKYAPIDRPPNIILNPRTYHRTSCIADRPGEKTVILCYELLSLENRTSN